MIVHTLHAPAGFSEDLLVDPEALLTIEVDEREIDLEGDLDDGDLFDLLSFDEDR